MGEIKPVAFVAPEFEGVEFPCIAVDPEYASTRHPFGKPEFEWTPLYDQQAIDTLRAEVEHWKEIAAANKQAEEHWLRRVRELLAER